MANTRHNLAMWTCAMGLPFAGCVAASYSQVADDGLRARAWATIATIRDDSVYSLEVIEQVTVGLPDGSRHVLADYRVFCDDRRRMIVDGQLCPVTRLTGAAERECRPLVMLLSDGIMKSARPQDGIGVVRVEVPDVVMPWCLPGAIKGLGYVPSVSQIHSRSDLVRRSARLRLVSETSAVAVISFEEPIDRRYGPHLLGISTSTGCTQSHSILDARWGSVAVEWRVPQWESYGDVWVPTRVELETFEPALDPAVLDEIHAAMEGAGLDRASMVPGHPRFGEWVEFRDGYFGAAGVPVSPSIAVQRSESEVVAVNSRLDALSLSLPEEHLRSLRRYFSELMQSTHSDFELEPVTGKRK